MEAPSSPSTQHHSYTSPEPRLATRKTSGRPSSPTPAALIRLGLWRGSGEVEGWCLVEGEIGVAIYSRPEAVAKNGITPASDYGEAVVGQAV